MWVTIWLRAGYSLGLIFPTDGMFAILLPNTLAPLVVTLVYGEPKAKELGLLQLRHQGISLRSVAFRSLFILPKATGPPSGRR